MSGGGADVRPPVEHGNGAAGLGLVVEDAWTGVTDRPVAALSGGESFLASLALALGLSDVVLRRWLDALFVDEGFGSLDEETLDDAIGALEELSEHGRLVGGRVSVTIDATLTRRAVASSLPSRFPTDAVTLLRFPAFGRPHYRHRMLDEFLTEHRDAIIERARAKVAQRRVPIASPGELANGVPLFLSQMTDLLRAEREAPPVDPAETTQERAHTAIGASADARGNELLREGLTVAQVVEGYGDICQAITEHATQTKTTIGAAEYRTLNLCLDVATARAVAAFSDARDRRTEKLETERLGMLAHELRNLLSSALLSYQALKGGAVGIEGSTGALLGRSLRGLRDVIDRSLAEVRLGAALRNPERVVLAELIEDVEVGAALDAKERAVELRVPLVDRAIAIHVDRQLLASAVANLLQNAIKFTRPGGRVSLTVQQESGTTFIEIEDDCGGLADDGAEVMFQPFDRRRTSRKGLGLGLKISREAVKANGGDIRVRNLPGKGCVFTIALPPTV